MAENINKLIKKPVDFRINENDNSGEKIERIYSHGQDYVVYRTKRTICVDYDDESVGLDAFLDNHSKLSVDLARVYSWLPENLNKSETINRQIARSVAVNILGKYDQAKIMLDHAEERIKKLKTISGRLEYTFSSFGVAVIALIIMIIFNVSDTYGYELFSSYYIYSKIAFFGALGGIISVSLGFPKLEIDIDANTTTNFMIGSSRIVISIAAAIFSYFAIKSGVAFSFLAENGQKHGVIVVAMVAGFSEMLIPNIMTNISKSAEEKSAT